MIIQIWLRESNPSPTEKKNISKQIQIFVPVNEYQIVRNNACKFKTL